ncbi:MAG: alpha/beta fold hydrolase [Anaerolineae bacterium]|nr:alpha/beta fold hydrolase [Anaerolineae bacterium]
MKILSAFALVLLSSLGIASAQAQGGVVPRFEPAPCPVSYPARYDVSCGYVIVPEEHANPDGDTLRVMVAIFHTGEHDRQPDPVIYLAGGPGSYTLQVFATGLGGYLDRALPDRDVILLDQRGMGFSEPSLNCPEVDELYTRAVIGPMSEDVSLSLDAAQRCFERLTADGVNLAAFNTVESAADVADVAAALGYEQINIYGGSYGSTLAMTVMRNHGAIVRSVMLQGITPPQVDLMASFAPDYEHSLNMLFEACAGDETCNEAFPQLESMFYAVVDRFKQEPLHLTIDNPLSNAPTRFIIDGDTFIRGMQSAIYSSGFLPQFPLVVAVTYAGDYSALEQMLVEYLRSASSGTDGALYAMRCMDDVMTTTEATWEAAVSSINPALQAAFRSDIVQWAALCPNWGARQLDPVENTPVTSDIPTLIMNGAYDPVTPAVWGALAAETLSHGYNYTFPLDAHGVYSTPCTLNMYDHFLADPSKAPDASCIDRLLPMIFAHP